MSFTPTIPAPQPICDASTPALSDLADTMVNLDRLRRRTTGQTRQLATEAMRATEAAITAQGGWIDWYRDEGDMTIHAPDRTVLATF